MPQVDEDLPTIRVSIGSAIHLGLTKGTMDAVSTTAYLLTFIKGKCIANCAFCAQARESSSRADMLSRVTWPPFPTKQVIEAIANSWSRGELQRTCIQTVNHPSVFRWALATVRAIRNASVVPVSVSCMPFSRSEMEELREAGVERIGIPLDAATEKLFDKVKGRTVGGPYCWEYHMRALKDAVEVFDRGKVSTHLMVGLGETDHDLLKMVQTMKDMGVYPALFAFTPVVGSRLDRAPQPDLRRYHRIQLAHNLIIKGITSAEELSFDSNGNLSSFGVNKGLLREISETGLPYVTSGCPGCNRPYYNERPGGKIYNYPARPKGEEALKITREILEEN